MRQGTIKVWSKAMKAPSAKTFAFGPFRLDVANWRLTRDHETVALEPQVFALLKLLVENRGELLEKRELLARLWPDTHVEERTLTQHVYVLRRALGPLGYQYIENVPRKGYRFVAEVTVTEVSPEPAAAPRPSSLRFAWITALSVSALAGWMIPRAEPDATGRVVPRLQRLTDHGSVRFAALAPDGTRVAYQLAGPRGESLRIAQTDRSSESEVLTAEGGRFQGLTFSPDGDWLYYVRDFRLWRIRPGEGSPKHLIDGVDRPISFSADGRHFTFIRDDVARGESAVYVATADGADARTVAVRKKPNIYRAVAWHPSGSTIAAAGGHEGHAQMEIVTIDVQTGRERPFGKVWPHVGEIAWYADGSALAAIVRRERAIYRQIVRIAYPAGDDTAVTDDLDDYRSLSVDRDGMLTSVQTGQQSHLWLLAPDAAPRALTSGSGDDQHPAWVGDDAIVYQHRSGGRRQIYRLDVSKGTTRPLTSDDCDNTAPAATPDGEWIVFVSACTGPGGLSRMRSDGRDLRQLTSGAGDNHPSISGDGRWVYYESLEDGKPIVKRIPINGGTPQRVTRHLSRVPAISPQHDLLACYLWDEQPGSSANVVLVSASDGTLRRSLAAAAPERRWPFIRWSPDGRSVVTIGRHGDQNLWGYPVDGGAPTALTAFADALHSYSFAWAPDGNALVMARGQTRDDVVLIAGDRSR